MAVYQAEIFVNDRGIIVMNILKKLLSGAAAMMMILSLFAGCSDSESTEPDDYSGVLTKVRLGMPMDKVISLNSSVQMYYENDQVIWCINPDTDLMEIKNVIPDGEGFYNVDDSLITYNFKYDEKEDENYLTGYIEEVQCMLDRETATKYYEDKIKRLKAKYSCPQESVSSTTTGTEGVDLNLDYKTKMTLSSFDLVLTMRLTYDTVNGVEGYYATYYGIEVNELKNKTAVPDESISSEE